jgi:hypothetical protein
MNLRFPLFLLISLLFALSASGQNRCATMERLNYRISQDPEYAAQIRNAREIAESGEYRGIDSIITIPVVVHILWNDELHNLNDDQIKSQIDVLNEDYGAYNSNVADVPQDWKTLVHDSKIRFCLARRDTNGNPTSGIIRRQTDIDEFAIQDNRVYDSALGGSSGWPRNRYLNIWVCNLEGNALGYASFPGSTAGEDGVVISYKAFGRIGASLKKPYNAGRTTTHEVGHWLGLVHIWGDDNGLCSNGDNISDTPNQADAHYRCETFPSTDACTQSSPGVMFMNYMDYTDDACMMFFTPGQTTRMRSTLWNIRAGILSSPGVLYQTVNGTEASLDSVLSPLTKASELCFKPSLRVYNNGTDTIHHLQFRYRLNEGLNKQFISEEIIAPAESKIFTLEAISAPQSDRILEISLMLNDSVKADNYVSVSLRMSMTAVNNCIQSQPFIYPNPVGLSQLACLKTNYPESRLVNVSVYDMTGRRVIGRELEMNPGDALPLDMRTMKAGMYIAELSSDQSVETVKFIYHPDDASSGYGYVCN